MLTGCYRYGAFSVHSNPEQPDGFCSVAMGYGCHCSTLLWTLCGLLIIIIEDEEVDGGQESAISPLQAAAGGGGGSPTTHDRAAQTHPSLGDNRGILRHRRARRGRVLSVAVKRIKNGEEMWLQPPLFPRQALSQAERELKKKKNDLKVNSKFNPCRRSQKRAFSNPHFWSFANACHCPAPIVSAIPTSVFTSPKCIRDPLPNRLHSSQCTRPLWCSQRVCHAFFFRKC